VRAHDDGIALRYRLPLPTQGDLVVKDDLTGFLFPRDVACHALNLGRFGTSHEGEYDPIRASWIRPHHLVGRLQEGLFHRRPRLGLGRGNGGAPTAAVAIPASRRIRSANGA